STPENAAPAANTLSPRSSRSRRLVVDLQHEAIISQLDTRRQVRVRLRVAEIVADVREVRALGAQALRHGDRFGDAEVRRVRPVAQRIEDHDAHAVEERPRFVVNSVAVGELAERATAKSEQWQE